jgi:HSP20 family protein
MNRAIAKQQNGNPSFGTVVDDLFQNSLRRFFDDNFWEMDVPLGKGKVPVNVREKDDHYEMDVVAPGCRKEDFNIQVADNTLTISFDHKDEKNQKDLHGGWVRNEYIQQSFSRSFTLDDTVDVNKVTANYQDGILHLVLPKNEKAKKISRNVEIK